ncbi:biotin/lipoyl-binding protein, partial [Lysobacter sp. 2RAB21]
MRGLVAQVLVRHNQAVKRGDALLRIDSEEFDAKVASASADLQDARAAVQAAQAALFSLDAEEKLAAASVHAAQVSIRASDAQSEVAQANRVRYDNLVASGAVARQDVEQFRAAAVTAQVGAQRSRAEFAVSRNQAGVTRAKRSQLIAAQAQAQATVARAQAALNLALQDQRHTLI